MTVLYDEWIDDRPGQIWSVSGTVLPISTSGRPSAPDPWNGYEVGTAVGLDRGHIMALSNGGPDISRCVPSTFQTEEMMLKYDKSQNVMFCFQEISSPKVPNGKELEDGEDWKLQSNYTQRININGSPSHMLLKVCYSVC